jgi:isoquinoline 1-oxidoreductase beta subunit
MTIHDKQISRRTALAGLGGFTFCAAIGTDSFHLVADAQAAAMANAQVTPWVRIAPDGTVTIFSAGAEMGQGSLTGLPLIVAEELDADWSKVVIEMAPADKSLYGYMLNNERGMSIVGSRATQLYFNDMRITGAQVRKVLIANAAQKWSVDAATLKTEPGFVVNPANGAKLSYGEIASFGEIPNPLPAVDPKELKARKDFRLIGKGLPRRDIPLKVNGTARFAMDVKLPDMVHATVLHSPVQGAQPESWNDDAIKKMPGIIATVKLPGAIGIVATHFEQAMAAKDALKATWGKSKVDGFDSEKALEDYVRVAADPQSQVTVLEQKGDVNAAFAKAAKTYKADFRTDYAYHAQMEPLNAVARIAGDKVEVWEGTQAPDLSRAAVAKALGVPEANVTLNQCFMGGGFGRRSLGDYSSECALIAKAVGKPVKLIWTRQDDLSHGRFRSPIKRSKRRSTATARSSAGNILWSVTDPSCCIPASRFPITACPISTSSGAASHTAYRSSSGARSDTSPTSSPSRAWSTAWRSMPRWTRSSSG